MSYTPVTFVYGEVITSAKMNQLAENDRVAAEWISDRTALPHARVRHTAGSAIGAAGWGIVPLNTTPADGGTSNQGNWSISSQGITIVTAGLYLVTVATSMTGSDFAARLLNSQPEPDVVLAQTAIGTSVSLTSNMTAARRMVPGDSVVWQVYKVTAGNMEPDTAAKPCYLDIIRLSD